MSLTNAQYNQIMRIYDQRRLNSRRTQDQHIGEVYDRIPRIEQIASEISSLSLKKAEVLMAAIPSGNFDLKAEIRRLSDERRELLVSHGYPEDYLELHYVCPICRDTGFVGRKKCSCFRKIELDYLYSGSNGKNILDEENFDHFSLEYYSDTDLSDATGLSARATAESALAAAKSFAENFGSDYRNLCFYGNTGVGKSFLSNCIAHEVISRGYSVLYLTAYDFFELLARETFGRESGAEHPSGGIFEADLLILDDLGTELTNAFTASRLFLCVNERILKKKPVIISTNLSLRRFSELYSERTFSRILSNYQLIHLFGKDIRIQKQLGGY